MAEADEDSTLRRLSALRNDILDSTIRDHGGRVVKGTGDGLLAEFPSVIEAVRAACLIQARVAGEDDTIRFRIGTNLGDVVHEDGDILGDGVNVAARLEGLAPPGAICISGTAYDQIGAGADPGFRSMGDVHVKNLSRPIRAYLFDPAEDASLARRVTPGSHPSRRWPAAALFSLVVLLAVTGWYAFSNRAPPGKAVGAEERIRLAVLPFQNTGNDPDQDYFVDGVTDDLITDLSKISSLFVIARNSAFAYKGRNIPPREIARELDVRYVLTGSVRQAEEQIRVNARLVDTSTGGQVWADRFDGALSDIFALQDRVTGRIVSALSVELTPDERARIINPREGTTPEAYDLFLRGVDRLRGFRPDTIREARQLFLSALAQDPGFARAHAAVAYSFVASGIFYLEDDTAMDQAILYARRAVELDPDLPQAQFSLGMVLQRRGQYEEALLAIDRALELDPNYADGYGARGWIQAHSGDGEAALASIRKAMELNPRYSAPYIDVEARAHFVESDYDAAIEDFERCIDRDPALLGCRILLAASLALAGRTEDARWQAEEAFALGIEANSAPIRNRIVRLFADAEDTQRLIKGLTTAGLLNDR